MEFFPTVQVPVKDLRLILRRINKCIRDLGDLDPTNSSNSDPDLQKITDLIYSKAFERIADTTASKKYNDNESADAIFNELI